MYTYAHFIQIRVVSVLSHSPSLLVNKNLRKTTLLQAMQVHRNFSYPSGEPTASLRETGRTPSCGHDVAKNRTCRFRSRTWRIKKHYMSSAFTPRTQRQAVLHYRRPMNVVLWSPLSRGRPSETTRTNADIPAFPARLAEASSGRLCQYLSRRCQNRTQPIFLKLLLLLGRFGQAFLGTPAPGLAIEGSDIVCGSRAKRRNACRPHRNP